MNTDRLSRGIAAVSSLLSHAEEVRRKIHVLAHRCAESPDVQDGEDAVLLTLLGGMHAITLAVRGTVAAARRVAGESYPDGDDDDDQVQP